MNENANAKASSLILRVGSIHPLQTVARNSKSRRTWGVDAWMPKRGAIASSTTGTRDNMGRSWSFCKCATRSRGHQILYSMVEIWWTNKCDITWRQKSSAQLPETCYFQGCLNTPLKTSMFWWSGFSAYARRTGTMQAQPVHPKNIPVATMFWDDMWKKWLPRDIIFLQPVKYTKKSNFAGQTAPQR